MTGPSTPPSVDDWKRWQVQHLYEDASDGIWKVSHFEIRPGDLSFERLRAVAEGRDPGTGRFVGLLWLDDRNGILDWSVMMSDSRAEILEHYPAIERFADPSCRRVLIHGLGIGVVLHAALSFPHIEHVDVVELAEPVIRLAAPVHAADPRVTVHPGDAYAHEFPPGTRWDVVWHDIWPALSADNLPQMDQLRRRYEGCCGWQGSWAEEYCRALPNRPVPQWLLDCDMDGAFAALGIDP